VSYILVELHTQVRARIRIVVDPKTDNKRFTAAQVDNWHNMDVLTALDVLIEPNAAALVDGNSLVAALENIELVPSEFFVSRYYETLEHQLSTIYRQFMLIYEDCCHEESAPQVRAIDRAVKKSSEGQRLNKLIREKNVDGHLPRSVGEYMNAAEDLAAEAETALRKARKYTDVAGGKTSARGAGVKRRQQASAYKKKCHGCGMFDHVHQDCFYRTHPYFYKEPTIEYAQSPVGIRYYNKYGGRYIKERDMDPTLHKNDRGASMLRKRSRLEDFAGFSGKSLGSERSVSRSREPSQHSRGDSSIRADTSVYIPAHQRDRRIGESNSDSRRKEFYERPREAVSSRDHGRDYAKDQDRSKDYGKDKDRDRHREAVRDQRSSGRDPTPERRSHSREKVDDHKKRAGDSRDTKDGQDTRERRREFSPHSTRQDRSGNCECTQVDDDYTNVCAFLDAAPIANEADRVDDQLLSASISHPSRHPRTPSLCLA
jgi:hypothetical protein